jgi:hypothetical protein
MSDLEAVNALLTEIAEANDGVNHVSEYSLTLLPSADSMNFALDAYFSAMSTSNSAPQPAVRWNIRTTELDDAKIQLRAATRRWFYDLEFSPNVDGVTAEKVIGEFMVRLESIVGLPKVCEVKVHPPMWYECDWQDFAFDSGQQRWLLHFGFSD